MPTHLPEREDSYALLDSGEGMRLERFGAFVLARPDPEALWKKSLAEAEWKKADATYRRSGATGDWSKASGFPRAWNAKYDGLNFVLRPTSFKHVGLFPEQKVHWQWLAQKIAAHAGEPIKVLNIFAYTGGATLSAARAGAQVTHVDSSKVAIEWARANAEASDLSALPIRWIEDDALQFLRREVKRGNKYDVVIMDPPAFGHGSKGAIWKIERDFYELMDLVGQVLSENPLAVILNGYTAGYSPLTLHNNLLPFAERFGGTVESGELGIREESGGRVLPAGVFARYARK